MDFTLIIDCGSHSTKYAGFAKRNRRKDWSENQVKTVTTRSLGVDPSGVAGRWNSALPSLVSKEVAEDEELTLVLLMDTFSPRSLREHLVRTAFEHTGAKQLALCFTAATALFAAGSTSGVSVDIGHSGVSITPVDRGVLVPAMAARFPSVGCHAVDAAILAKLRADHPSLPGDTASVLAVDSAFMHAKGHLCGFDEAPQTREGDEEEGKGSGAEAGAKISLPDGTIVTMESSDVDRSHFTQPLFYAGGANVPMSFGATYQKFTLDFTSARQWVCCGGGTLVPGAMARLNGGLSCSMFGLPAKQLTLRNPITAATEGALILSHLSSFKGMCVSLAEYEEEGPSQCVHVKCVDLR